jgi:hypothetical protein
VRAICITRARKAKKKQQSVLSWGGVIAFDSTMWCDGDVRADEENIPEVKFAVTSSGEDLSRASDFSAAYARGMIVGVYGGTDAGRHVPRGLRGVSSLSR